MSEGPEDEVPEDESVEVDIRPEVNILSVLRHLNYKPWFALGEFVDNSLASYLANRGNSKEPLRVSIDIDAENNRILIADNAYGIAAKDFKRAFKAADAPPDRSGLSEFGMGMKSAASWFAGRWSVRTSVEGEPIQRTISFDLDDIVKHQTQSLVAAEAPADSASHFTVVELLDLNRLPQGGGVARIRQHLGSIYRQFLRRGEMELFVNASPVVFTEVEVLFAAPWESGEQPVEWRKPIEILFEDGRRISGFAAIRAKGSTAEAGFALFRRDRLIVGSYDETYRPSEIFKKSTSFTYQRLFGELTLEGFDVTHTKDGFNWGEVEEPFLAALYDQMSATPLNLIGQAEDYRVNVPEPDEREPIADAVVEASESFAAHLPAILEENPSSEMSDAPIPDYLGGDVPELEAIKRTVRVETDEGPWVVDLTATLEDSVPDWLAVGSQMVGESSTGLPETHLAVVVSFAHPFARKYLGPGGENGDVLIAMASSLAVALALGKRAGARSQFVLNYLNRALRTF